MKIIKYFFEFIFIVCFFFIFKIIGYKNATAIGEIIGRKIGPFFRNNSKIQKNLETSNIGNSNKEREIIIDNMYFIPQRCKVHSCRPSKVTIAS